MHHASARLAIERTIAASAFTEQGLALTLAAGVADLPGADAALRARLIERAAAMAPDLAVNYAGDLLDAPIPEDAAALAAQLAPAVAASAATPGLKIALLAALCALWPHVATSERRVMRARFLAGCVARPAPAGSTVTIAQLCTWQRDVPTCSSELPPSVASMKALLSATQPHLAYRVLADHLGCEMDLQTLHWVLGALSVEVLLHLRDPDGWLVHCLSGTVAGERLAMHTPPEHLATLVSQLGHHLWWCQARAALPPVRSCLDAPALPFLQAVRGGDITAAQRAARRDCGDPARFWGDVWILVDEAVTWDDVPWLRALVAATAIAWRTGDAMSPDDAAALGTVLADLHYRIASRTRPAALA